jgi:predicted phosphodiesterase
MNVMTVRCCAPAFPAQATAEAVPASKDLRVDRIPISSELIRATIIADRVTHRSPRDDGLKKPWRRRRSPLRCAAVAIPSSIAGHPSGPMSRESEEGRMVFRVLQVSDTHISRERPFFVPNFDAAVAHASAIRPDLVINTGDVALDGVARPDDLAFARSLHDRLGMDFRAIPGNHDIGDNPYPGRAPKQPVTAATLDAWRDLFGPDWWSLDVPSWRMVALNAQLLGTGLQDEHLQWRFLESTLQGLDGRSLALWIHKPLFLDDPRSDTEPAYRYLPRSERLRLCALLADAPLRLVACGHSHQYVVRQHGACRHVWAPATAFILSDAIQSRVGHKTCGMVLHEFGPDGVASQLVRPDTFADFDIADHPGAYGRPAPAEPAVVR